MLKVLKWKDIHNINCYEKTYIYTSIANIYNTCKELESGPVHTTTSYFHACMNSLGGKKQEIHTLSCQYMLSI